MAAAECWSCWQLLQGRQAARPELFCLEPNHALLLALLLPRRLEKALAQQGTCSSSGDGATAGPPAPPGSHVAPVPNTTPRHSRRTEILQNQVWELARR